MQSILKECASFKRLFMDLNRLLVARISASMRKSHSLDFLEAKMSPVYMSKLVEVLLSSWPDVSFALSMVSRHQQNPGEGHWTTVKNILKYLRNTKDRFIVYDGEEELSVTGYCDASWQTDRDDIRS
ncbi:hypothetical protein Tco_1526737 [Tanacetum coccineum]